MDTKIEPTLLNYPRTYFNTKDIQRLIVKSWRKYIPINRPRKQASIAILISDKTNFKTKHVRRDRKGHYVPTKEKINQKDIFNP